MSQTPETQWIHIGHCPVCGDGLCRIRSCADASGQPHFYAMCDECESLWLKPTTETSDRLFADAESPVCPVCSAELYGSQSDWASLEAIQVTEWADAATVEVAEPKNDSSSPPSEDLAYGQDDPKPGC